MIQNVAPYPGVGCESLFSGDVHADIDALRALFAEIDRAGIDRVWCLGDFAFGGQSAAACFDLTMQKAEVVLAGNHEWVRSRKAEDPFMISHPLHFPEYADLGHARLKQLLALEPYVVVPDLGVELVHGSLTDPTFGFVRGGQSARGCLDKATEPIVVCGHTHEAAYYRETPSGSVERVSKRVGVSYLLDRRCVLNPGAGRDGPLHSRWLELSWEVEDRAATWHRLRVHRGDTRQAIVRTRRVWPASAARISPEFDDRSP